LKSAKMKEINRIVKLMWFLTMWKPAKINKLFKTKMMWCSKEVNEEVNLRLLSILEVLLTTLKTSNSIIRLKKKLLITKNNKRTHEIKQKLSTITKTS
jgi:hypothetical protein